MFEGDWDELDAAATLDAAVEFDLAENHAALGKLRAALHFADLHADLPIASQHAPTLPGGERLTVYGGDGCPAVAEFAPAEFAAVLGLAPRTAAAFIGEAQALRHRFPRVWARTLAEQAPAWRARAVARACLTLSRQAAAHVDRGIVGTIDTLPTHRFYKLLHALIKQADPEAARRAAEKRAKDRGVFVNPSDGDGTKTIYVKAATGDVIRFDATICDLAWALAMMGDTDTLDQRRAKAIGWIADPAAAYELLNAARYLATQQRNGTTTPGAACNGTCDGTCTTDTSTDADDCDDGQSSTSDDGVAAAADEPGLENEADRDTPHPSTGEHLDHLDDLTTRDIIKAIADQAWRYPRPQSDCANPSGGTVPPPPPQPLPPRDDAAAGPRRTGLPSNSRSACASSGVDGGADGGDAGGGDAFSRQALADKLAAIKQAAHATGLGSTGGRGRPRTVLYAHLTDETLLSGDGIVRVEEHGALLVSQLRELLGHDQVVLKPVIDLNDKISVDAYEIPTRIRERVKLMHPAERFPFGSSETTMRTDLDHVAPYDPTGPPGQTSTTNLSPLARLNHRLKTRGDWNVDQLDDTALRWISPNGFKFRVDHTGTRRITDSGED